jgi:hypothetical protein
MMRYKDESIPLRFYRFGVCTYHNGHLLVLLGKAQKPIFELDDALAHTFPSEIDVLGGE